MLEKSFGLPLLLFSIFTNFVRQTTPCNKLCTMKYVTIKDIAKALGMSKSTVSRALHNDSLNVSEKTRKLVQYTARQMGFHRNLSAANLSKHLTRTIGIIVPEMETSFYTTFIEYAQAIFKKAGFRVALAQSGENTTTEFENLMMMVDYHVDGILMSMCDCGVNKIYLRDMIAQGMPIVFFDRRIKDIDAPQVVSEDQYASFFLVEQLIRMGRKDIVFFKGPDYILNSLERECGYIEALDKWNLPLRKEYAVDGGLSFHDGEIAALKLLDSGLKFDAIHAFTEMPLLGAKNVLQSRGIRIPEDVALACMSGTNLCKMVYPKITAVEQDTEKMASTAASTLIDLIEGKKVENEIIEITPHRIERESTGK